MDICSDGHKEVAYEGRDCPVCEQIKTVSDLEDEIYNLKEEIEKLNQEE